MVRKYYLSSPKFTVQVNVNDASGCIVWGAPVIRVFIGQPFKDLVRWSRADVVEEIKPYSNFQWSGERIL